ncbi:MAG: hypothetical protein H0U07_10015 [Actinobacteria bacterium]|nr:hypothetical protein [Actinomycetota bacterium]
MTEPELTRRRLLELGLALPPLAALAGTGRLLDDAEAAGPLAPTPTIVDDDEPTPELTEGPYFTPNSPRRRGGRHRGRHAADPRGPRAHDRGPSRFHAR